MRRSACAAEPPGYLRRDRQLLVAQPNVTSRVVPKTLIDTFGILPPLIIPAVNMVAAGP
jgi:hypothetical protein